MTKTREELEAAYFERRRKQNPAFRLEERRRMIREMLDKRREAEQPAPPKAKPKRRARKPKTEKA